MLIISNYPNIQVRLNLFKYQLVLKLFFLMKWTLLVFIKLYKIGKTVEYTEN